MPLKWAMIQVRTRPLSQINKINWGFLWGKVRLIWFGFFDLNLKSLTSEIDLLLFSDREPPFFFQKPADAIVDTSATKELCIIPVSSKVQYSTARPVHWFICPFDFQYR
jgi:hypothetical protein